MAERLLHLAMGGTGSGTVLKGFNSELESKAVESFCNMTKARPPTWLLDHKNDVHSQAGEDGIIEAILSALGTRDKWCVEFGAWDGKHLSNTRNLIKNSDYRAVLIEGNSERYKDLRATYNGNSGVIAVNAFVGFDPHNGLDTILAATSIPRDFDLCSIDIDGNDYHAWKAIEVYRPKLICIEFNPTIPTDCAFVQPADPALNQGAGIMALVELGKSKGYELASVLPWNAFFVRSDLFPCLEIVDNSAQTLRTDLSHITHLFQGYDGTIFARGNRRLLWHDIAIDEKRLQLLPKPLRKYPGSYSFLERCLMGIYRRWLARGRSS
jgi:hypothetical protein